ncbi:calmodulin-binding receptor-like cytoplasmic kinase 2 [Rutidosis leptorrhynchoides]|uniref:calmodulin-binding receptor-like cytoplasmic kinase 2 n=1 Tax=Rutidosis leptorrhynchoides TaxID=125765 RepID=UPI003A99F020
MEKFYRQQERLNNWLNKQRAPTILSSPIHESPTCLKEEIHVDNKVLEVEKNEEVVDLEKSTPFREKLLVLEYVPNKSLFDKMHVPNNKSDILTWSNRVNIALDVARALDYLHSEADPPIIHRDVKSSNILLVDYDHAKLADFGLCKLGQENNHKTTTPSLSIKDSLGYIDVTYMKTGQLSTKSDVYSYGILLLELITGLKSMQGSISLAELTEDDRREEDVKILAENLLDPKLKKNVSLLQLKVLLDLANAALLENPECRSNMNRIVDAISSCIQPQSYIDHQLPLYNC